ncbi:unnamed protein product [Chondrus crispus]|uniref:Uncharacterized protein n=1 Tax=Chondrus crispus TaxID=2769 RepID=R7QMG8_CHOCR|nr:unnamed protein product [Chondrus crispus]CDF39294.1 unnamed protein product [Chondrus crispus]|eukprot:XP_005719205.1 unnamed protein product [Chondrus crispus]
MTQVVLVTCNQWQCLREAHVSLCEAPVSRHPEV